MNFAPYQDQSPEIERALSPPLADVNRAKSPNGRSPRLSPVHAFSPSGPSPPSRFSGRDQRTQHNGSTGSGRDIEGGRSRVFETSLPIRMDFEAMLAYLLLPPAGGVFLLLVEHKSDYVRFHAWQSSMLFTVIFVVHMIFAWSSVISWFLLACDVVLIGFLSVHAYRDVDSLERYEVPFFGPLANTFVEDE